MKLLEFVADQTEPAFDQGSFWMVRLSSWELDNKFYTKFRLTSCCFDKIRKQVIWYFYCLRYYNLEPQIGDCLKYMPYYLFSICEAAELWSEAKVLLEARQHFCWVGTVDRGADGSNFEKPRHPSYSCTPENCTWKTSNLWCAQLCFGSNFK